MTALEKLIKLASTDASELYRRTAVNAKLELLAIQAELDTYRKHLKAIQACTPPNSMSK